MPNYYKSWPIVKICQCQPTNLMLCMRFTWELEVGEIDASCLNVIFKGLCGCGQMEAAFSVLDEFPKQKCRPNVRTFFTMMHRFCERGRVDEAFSLLERMETEGVKPDTIVFNILILVLRKRRRVEEGIKPFDGMMLKGCDPNSGTYQEVLYCLLDAKRFVEAKDFRKKMTDEGVIPSFESYKFDDTSWFLYWESCGRFRLGIEENVRHGFVPKMGIWKRVLHYVFLNGHIANSDHISYKEINKN